MDRVPAVAQPASPRCNSAMGPPTHRVRRRERAEQREGARPVGRRVRPGLVGLGGEHGRRAVLVRPCKGRAAKLFADGVAPVRGEEE